MAEKTIFSGYIWETYANQQNASSTGHLPPLPFIGKYLKVNDGEILSNDGYFLWTLRDGSITNGVLTRKRNPLEMTMDDIIGECIVVSDGSGALDEYFGLENLRGIDKQHWVSIANTSSDGKNVLKLAWENGSDSGVDVLTFGTTLSEVPFEDDRGSFYTFSKPGYIKITLTNLANLINGTTKISSGAIYGSPIFVIELYDKNNVLVSTENMIPVSPATSSGSTSSTGIIEVPQAGSYYVKLNIGNVGAYAFYNMKANGSSVTSANIVSTWSLYLDAKEYGYSYVEGKVKDYSTSSNIMGAKVTLQNTSNTVVTTDSYGKFKILVDNDHMFSDSICVLSDGYKVQSIPINGVLDVGTLYLLNYSGNIFESNKIACIEDFRGIDSNSFKDNPRNTSELISSYSCDTFTISNDVSITSGSGTTSGLRVLKLLGGGRVYKVCKITTPSDTTNFVLYLSYKASITPKSGSTAIGGWNSLANPTYVYIQEPDSFSAGSPGFAQLGRFAPQFGTTSTQSVNYSGQLKPNTSYSIFINDGPIYQMVSPKSSTGASISSGTYTVKVEFTSISGPFYKTYQTGIYDPTYCPPYLDVKNDGVFIANGSYSNNQCVSFGDLTKFKELFITSLSFQNGTLSTLSGGESKTLKVSGRVDGESVVINNNELEWRSSNTSIATVSNGIVTANNTIEGTTTITASTNRTQNGNTLTVSHVVSVRQLRLEDCIGSIICDTNGFSSVVGSDWNASVQFIDDIPSTWVNTTVYFKVYNASGTIISHPGGSSNNWSFTMTSDLTSGTPKLLKITSGQFSSLMGTKANPASYIKIVSVSNSAVKYRGTNITVQNI